MVSNQLPHDLVATQYEQWVYPEPIEDLPGWLADNWQWFDPSHSHRLFWPNHAYRANLDILIAGCGSNQAAVFAYTNPGAKIVAVDVSSASLQRTRFLKEKYGLANLELQCLPIERLADLAMDFDLIVSTGVLHHLADPLAGMLALAGCLRPDGVAAIMLYARYGRLGVEMLQGVFRDLGLGQDENSLSVVKAAIEDLGSDHPLRGYIKMAPDLNYDAGIVDTFLHGRDRSYTVRDCLDLVSSAGLVFQDWLFKSPYALPSAPRNSFEEAVSALPLEMQWSVMERINHNNGCHFFTACRPERPADTYKIDFASIRWLDAVPMFRYRCGLEGETVKRPGWCMKLGPTQYSFAKHIDGRNSIRNIIDKSSLDLDPPVHMQDDVIHLVRELFSLLVNRDFLVLAG